MSKSTVIVSYRLNLDLPTGLFFKCFHKILYAFLISTTSVTFPPHHIYVEFITFIIFGGKFVSATSWEHKFNLKIEVLNMPKLLECYVYDGQCTTFNMIFEIIKIK